MIPIPANSWKTPNPSLSSVREFHLQEGPQGLLVGVPLAGQEMDDGVPLPVPAVEAPDGGPGVGGEVVHHLGQVAGHQALVGDGRNLECCQLIVILRENSLADPSVLVLHYPLDEAEDLGVSLSEVGDLSLGTENREDGVLMRSYS